MSVQVCEIAGFIYTGIILGIIYGIFDVILYALSAKRIVIHVFDFIYVCVCFAVTALSLYLLTYGKVSPAYIAAVFAGAFLYLTNMHRLVKESVHKK